MKIMTKTVFKYSSFCAPDSRNRISTSANLHWGFVMRVFLDFKTDTVDVKKLKHISKKQAIFTKSLPSGENWQ